MLTPLRLELVLTRMTVTLVSGKAVRRADKRAGFTLPTSSRKLAPVMLRMVKPVATLAVNSGAAGADARSRPSAKATAMAAAQSVAHAAAKRRALRHLGLPASRNAGGGAARTMSCGFTIGARAVKLLRA